MTKTFKGKKILALSLSLAMMLGMTQVMSLTAYATTYTTSQVITLNDMTDIDL